MPGFKSKIIIIGEAGRGKTTLANRLSKKLGIPHYSTDDFYWEVKYTKPRQREIAFKMAEETFSRDKWIVEGTTQWLIKVGLEKADLILFLHFKTIFHQWFYIIKRHFARRDGSKESILSLMKHVFYKKYNLGYKKGSITHKEIIEPYKEKVIELTSFKKINDFIKKI